MGSQRFVKLVLGLCRPRQPLGCAHRGRSREAAGLQVLPASGSISQQHFLPLVMAVPSHCTVGTVCRFPNFGRTCDTVPTLRHPPDQQVSPPRRSEFELLGAALPQFHLLLLDWLLPAALESSRGLHQPGRNNFTPQGASFHLLLI